MLISLECVDDTFSHHPTEQILHQDCVLGHVSSCKGALHPENMTIAQIKDKNINIKFQKMITIITFCEKWIGLLP